MDQLLLMLQLIKEDVETSKPTTHAAPTYIVDNVVHYCVANMPGGFQELQQLH